MRGSKKVSVGCAAIFLWNTSPKLRIRLWLVTLVFLPCGIVATSTFARVYQRVACFALAARWRFRSAVKLFDNRTLPITLTVSGLCADFRLSPLMFSGLYVHREGR